MNTAPRIKLFVAALVSPDIEREAVVSMLSEVFGSVDFVGPPHPFDVTDYYLEEMGSHLLRFVVGFTGPHHADILVPGKRACIELENGLAVEGKRKVNLDLGYLDHHKVVLASTKGAAHKLFISDGIYGDLVARYSQGAYRPFEWSFPDFKDGRYNAELEALRRSLRESLRNEGEKEPA